MVALTAGDIRALLRRTAHMLGDAGSDDHVVLGLQELSQLLSRMEELRFTEFLKLFPIACALERSPSGQVVATIVPTIEGLIELLRAVAKKDLLTGLDSLLKVLSSNPGATFGGVSNEWHAIVSASQSKKRSKATSMDQALIGDYICRLTAALGDPAKFELLFKVLNNDQRIGQAESVELATRFYGKTPPKLTRPKALARIRERHDNLMTFDRPSTAGRSAA